MSFPFQKLTIKAQQSVQRAQSLAQTKGHPEVGTLHLAAAVAAEKDGIVPAILRKIGGNQGQLGGMLQNE
ncbi:MAG: hypothetical protein FJ276_02980, partial [Planctomycetes bacterium]|nr:hypothetical protein [Planctomycetota bacterium]